jgi:formylglycine-generating enzyme
METEISRKMWSDLKAVQGTLPSDPSYPFYSPTLAHPVQYNSWYESVLFANLLSLQNGFTRCYYMNEGFTIPIDSTNYTTGPFFCNFAANGYRLASEGEWEYFTRAGTTTPFSCNETNYLSNTCNFCAAGTHPTLETYCVYCANDLGTTETVGSKLPNPWNLKDVHGNVWEWCWDWVYSYPTGTNTDYTGPTEGILHVDRGGCWDLRAFWCRSAFRDSNYPSYRTYYLGFRLVRTIN